ncbi:hypothetical protein ABMA28_004000 [Loxostege sticticalis]|uniref:Gag-like protein n=1 Tax=Loxostege sticticalis TaxID=481309 RepID=A0ABD0STU4_LOXSC
MLSHNKVKGIVKDGVKSAGRNRVSIEFKTAADANTFVPSQFLASNGFKAIIPTYNVTRMGIVRGVPVDWSLDEFIESLELPEKCGCVLKARRLNRKTTSDGNTIWTPTQTVVLTFAGQTLPKKVYSFHTSLVVETYLLPTIQCHNCCRFGHVKSQCRSKARCFRCAQPHAGDECQVPREAASCLLCSGSHSAIDKSCPEQSRQRSIKLLMSQDNISYLEASARVPSVRRPYNEVTKTPINVPTPSMPQRRSSQAPTPSPVSSYRKTVTQTPRPRTRLSSGFDRLAHQAIVADPPSLIQNGCALQNSSTKNDNLIESAIAFVIQIVSKFSDALPSNVATQLSELYSILPPESLSKSPSHNHGDGDLSDPSMEL